MSHNSALPTDSFNQTTSGLSLSKEAELIWGPKRDSLYVVVPLTVFYSAIFVSGVVGNVSTCVVIARNRHMHTATNYYLFSLAVSDFLLLVVGLPPEMYGIWSRYPYVFGEVFCIANGFASETSSNATVLTITAFTVERYVAICHPFFSHKVSKLSRAVKFVIIIWFISVVCALPQALQFGLVYEVDAYGRVISEEYRICGVRERYGYSFELSMIVFFLVPMVIISVLYVKIAVRLYTSNVVVNQRRNQTQNHRDSRRGSNHGKSTRRVVHMLMAVVAAFFICWAPFQAQRLYALHAYNGEETSPEHVTGYKILTYISGILYFFSATVNPILYNIMSLKFRQAFKSTLTYCLSGKNHPRGELCGSSGGLGGAGSLLPGRFNYSVLSKRSYRNTNNNNSYSSGNSFVEGELTRRPLVVSFNKKKQWGRTSTSSLEPSPDKKITYLETPRTNYHSDGPIELGSSFLSPRYLKVHTNFYPDTQISSDFNSPRPNSNRENGKVPRIEDIEIFQESQLKITRRVPQDPSSDSRTIYIASKRTRVVNHSNEGVKKSHTAPCLRVNST